jgi:4-amino-4-deoxy-L-arabinose transferase-like glycosyltransferase
VKLKFLEQNSLLISIIFLGAVLRVEKLNLPVTYDEAYTYMAFVRQDWWGILSDYSLPNNHIFNTLLIKISTGLLGNHPWMLRLPAALTGLAAIPLVYGLGRRLYNTNVALLAATLVAGLPAIIHYDTGARGYSLVSLFTLSGFLFAWSAIEKGRWHDWLGLSISIALGFLSVPTMALPAGGIYLWALGETWMRGERRFSPYLHWLSSGFVAGLLTLAFYTPVLLVTGWRKLFANSFIQPVEPDAYFSKILLRQLSQIWEFWNREMLPVLGFLLILGIALSLVFSARNAGARFHFAVPIVLWITLYVLLRHPQIFDRFFSFLLPLGMLWAASGWLGLTDWLLKGMKFNASKGLVFLSIGLLAFMALVSVPEIPASWNKLSNVEVIAHDIARAIQPGDMVLAGYPNDTTLWYYLHREGVDDSAWHIREDFQRAFILTSTYYEQTVEQVIAQKRLELNLFDMESLTWLQRVGFLELYLVDAR